MGDVSKKLPALIPNLAPIAHDTTRPTARHAQISRRFQLRWRHWSGAEGTVFDGDDGRQVLVFDLDEAGGAGGALLGVGHDDAQRLPVVLHLVRREQHSVLVDAHNALCPVSTAHAAHARARTW